MTDRWDRAYLAQALEWAKMSYDPRTRVGCVVVGPKREVRSSGFNGMPRGIKDTPERLNDRDMKLKLFVHAERNAICNAARIGVALEGCTLYLAAFSPDDPTVVYSGSPCTACTIEIIQAGIVEIVGWPFKDGFSRWKEDLEFSREILWEAGLRYREVPSL